MFKILSVERYVELRAALASQSQTIELLRVQLNETRRELALYKHRDEGLPPVVPELEAVDPARALDQPRPKIVGGGRKPSTEPPPSMSELFTGNLGFEDMGDDAAKKAGIRHDAEGRVAYQD